MAIKSQKDLAAGLMFAVIGIAFAVGARDYSVGTSSEMGPGYFPTLLGFLLAGLGAAIALQSFGVPRSSEKIGPIAWRPLLFIIGANVVFGVLLGGISAIGLPPLGLIVAVLALVVCASMASKEFRFKEALALAVILALGCWVVFVKALDLPLQLWPAFITG